MNHDSISRRLGAYMDGEVPPQERSAVEAHLAQCPACAASLKELQSLSGAIRQIPLPPLDAGILRRLHAGVEQMGRRPVERFVGLLSGIAACLAVMGGLLLLRPAGPASLSPPARWEAHAVGMIDDSLIASGSGTRDTAIGEWMISSLSARSSGETPATAHEGGPGRD